MKCLLSGLLCSLVVISLTDARADARKDLEKELRTAYVHRLLSLTSPYFGDKLQFDSQGGLLDRAVAGPWSTCGLLEVEKLALASGRVELSGKRVILALRSSNTGVKVTPVTTNRGVHISVELPSTSTDVPQVNQTLSNTFKGGQLVERVAAYWKPYMDLGAQDLKGQLDALRKNGPNVIVAELEGARPVYLVVPGVVDPPVAIHTPDPEYTQEARQKKVNGTATLEVVVNEKGLPEILEVVRGLGEGLDIQALTTVAGWTFKPAVRYGEPVAVLMGVDVSFRIY
ncbi:MAG: energy transducer TonB [Terriglobales bacterium]